MSVVLKNTTKFVGVKGCESKQIHNLKTEGAIYNGLLVDAPEAAIEALFKQGSNLVMAVIKPVPIAKETPKAKE